MPIYDYKCQKCDRNFEKLIPLTEERHIIICPHCGSDIVERQFPDKMSFKLGRGKWDTAGWSHDGYTSRLPTHKVFDREGNYLPEYQKKHDSGGTDIND